MLGIMYNLILIFSLNVLHLKTENKHSYSGWLLFYCSIIPPTVSKWVLRYCFQMVATRKKKIKIKILKERKLNLPLNQHNMQWKIICYTIENSLPGLPKNIISFGIMRNIWLYTEPHKVVVHESFSLTFIITVVKEKW